MTTQDKSVWNWTRMSFWSMIVIWVLVSLFGYPVSNVGFLLVAFIFVGLVISTFVLSIIHLTKYKEKGLAITALVISSIGLLFVLIGFFGEAAV